VKLPKDLHYTLPVFSSIVLEQAEDINQAWECELQTSESKRKNEILP